MQSVTNPFEDIVSRLERLQSSVDLISVNQPKAQIVRQENPNALLNLKDVAAILKIPINTARYYIEHKKLPAVKNGKAFKIKQSDFLDWIDHVYLKKQPRESSEGNLAIAPNHMRSIHQRFKKQRS
ncbi:helix-turn-helix domain-containing protein [Rhizosphaericola mali]|uniref:Helix-turn-helix domain-containing protein n=1 Tax=Rhizosphaericola mali TaxID=2545455 RepID=A0A5P2FZS4_9BACT|nr:helix-turn-helix domain-containing protein [Rhizosphaericola mali]QES87359.1 helix-turn-helix domain-containing protein [Rhizosphaericola mali]